jgi:hypothetical protein
MDHRPLFRPRSLHSRSARHLPSRLRCPLSRRRRLHKSRHLRLLRFQWRRPQSSSCKWSQSRTEGRCRPRRTTTTIRFTSMRSSQPSSTSRWEGTSWTALTCATLSRFRIRCVRLAPSPLSCPIGWMRTSTGHTRFPRGPTSCVAVRATLSLHSSTSPQFRSPWSRDRLLHQLRRRRPRRQQVLLQVFRLRRRRRH